MKNYGVIIFAYKTQHGEKNMSVLKNVEYNIIQNILTKGLKTRRTIRNPIPLSEYNANTLEKMLNKCTVVDPVGSVASQ